MLSGNFIVAERLPNARIFTGICTSFFNPGIEGLIFRAAHRQINPFALKNSFKTGINLIFMLKLSCAYDDLHKYLPRYNTHGGHITIASLLTHTSGIPGYTEDAGFADIMQINLSKDSLMRWISRDSLLFEGLTLNP